jgi:hypothetical protein
MGCHLSLTSDNVTHYPLNYVNKTKLCIPHVFLFVEEIIEISHNICGFGVNLIISTNFHFEFIVSIIYIEIAHAIG